MTESKPIVVQQWPLETARTYYTRFVTSNGYVSWSRGFGFSFDNRSVLVELLAAIEGIQ